MLSRQGKANNRRYLLSLSQSTQEVQFFLAKEAIFDFSIRSKSKSVAAAAKMLTHGGDEGKSA
jgi:hypothetical protein